MSKLSCDLDTRLEGDWTVTIDGQTRRHNSLGQSAITVLAEVDALLQCDPGSTRPVTFSYGPRTYEVIKLNLQTKVLEALKKS